MKGTDNHMLVYLQHLLGLPPWTQGVYIDNRPSKYPLEDFRRLAPQVKLPIKVWRNLRKVKVGDRYIHIISADSRSVMEGTCGRELSIIGVHPHTSVSKEDALFLQTRLRGKVYDKKYSVKALNL